MAPNLLTAEGRQHLSYSFSRHNPAFVLPLLFLAAGAGLTVLASRLRSKVAIHLLLGTLILAELASFFFPLEGRWTSPAEIAAGQHKQLNSSLRDQAGYERILSLSDESSFNLPYGVNRLNAWQSLHPRRLFDLLESRPANNSSQVNEWEATLESNLPLSLLNVRYLTAEAGSNEAQQIRERRLHRPGPMKPVGPAVTSRLGPARALEVPVALEPGRTYELSFRTRNSGPEGFAVFSPESLKDGVHSVTLRETAGPERTVTHLLRTPTGVPGQGLLRFEGPESGGVADVRWGILEEVPGAPPPYERLDAIEGTELFRNRYCLPRAFCVAELKVVDGFEAIKRALFLGEVDPTRTALILPDEPILPRAVPRSTGTARILAFEPDRVHVEVSSARGTFLVLADQADPGWSATVDGRRTPLLAPFGFLRGLDVPAGVHEVRFDYRPAWMWQGIPPAAVALLVIVALLLGGRKRCHGSGSSASQKL